VRPVLALRCPGTLAPAACVEQARAAERAGFSTIWFPENPFGRGAWPSAAGRRSGPPGTRDRAPGR